MDFGSSPAQSPARSTTSAQQSGNEGVQLTPRSKIKALLAGLDDSDGETEPAANPRRIAIPQHHKQTRPLSANIESYEDNDEDDEDAVVVPRGRLAARLQGHRDTASDTAVSNVEHTTADGKIPADSDEDDDLQSQGGGRMPLKSARRLVKANGPSNGSDSELEASPEKQNLPAIDNNVDQAEEQGATGEALTGQIDNESGGNDSDQDLDIQSSRFQALVAKKRAERIAKEAAEDAKKAAKAVKHQKKRREADVSQSGSDDEDNETGAQLTQKSRPARKAGKKALEEMARETQRISRNMQLAHEAKVKKKIAKESFLQRFAPKNQTVAPASSSTNHSSTANSEDESIKKQTPLTSPEQSILNFKTAVGSVQGASRLAEGTSITSDFPESVTPIDKGKAREPKASIEVMHQVLDQVQFNKEPKAILPSLGDKQATSKSRTVLKQRPIRVIPSKTLDDTILGDTSDDDLEIVQSKAFRVFDNLTKPKHGAGEFHTRLRALARLNSPSKSSHDKDRISITAQELASSLRSKARQQAAAERAEKIEILRSKGVIIQTAEERQNDQMAVEDMLEKARREDEELTKKEKEATRKEKLARGEEVEESSGDEDYEENEDADQADLELSGSEDESADDHSAAAGDLIDHAASEASTEDGESEAEADIDEEAAEEPLGNGQSEDELDTGHSLRRRRNATRVIEDDSDGEEPGTASAVTVPSTLPVETSAIQNPFGPQTGLGDAPMGLTQAFAATLADSQFREGFSQEDSLLQLRTMPSPEFDTVLGNLATQNDNQATLEELDIDLHFTQTQAGREILPGAAAHATSTQLSELPDPTQDAGFQKLSPVLARFAPAPHSTIDTLIVPQESSQPPVKRRGLLARKQKRSLATFSDEEDDQADEQATGTESEGDVEESMDTAFSVMKKAAAKAKRKAANFDKTRSEAKEMFEEQAMESEDEYAGLGGASDDSEGEEDEETRRMIDEGEVEVNERKVAAYFAEKEREENEAGISKLYKDINSGALRRKRGAGADFDDLDDSDDEYAARQARKQREFARMRKALLDGDSNIVKIADDPKKMPFLRAIEDRDDPEDLIYLHSTPHGEDNEDASQEIIPDSQSENRPPGFLKRKRTDQDAVDPSAKRPITINSRRSVWTADKKPTSLADIQATVSFLIEEPDSMSTVKVGPTLFDVSSDIELDIEDEPASDEELIGEPDSAPKRNPRRTGPKTDVPKFIDRLSLKRQESSKDSQAGCGPLAFMDPRLALERSFKPPTLLRKATSSFSNFSGQDENGISTNNNAKKPAIEVEVKGRGVGGGSKRSSVNWYAREAERKSALAKRTGSASDTNTSVRRQSSGLSTLLRKSSAWD